MSPALKKIYVDHFNEDGSMAVVLNQKTIRYNLFVLGRDNSKSPAFTVGRFICILMSVDMQGSAANMIFLDLRKNPDVAKDLVNSPDMQPETKAKFISLIEAYNATYDSVIPKFALVQGFPPSIVD